MKPSKAEEQLAAFLELQPSWLRKLLQLDYSLTPAEGLAWANSGHQSEIAKEEYEKLLQKIPEKWREYREELKRRALANIPQASPGRPRKDEIAERAQKLRKQGKSYEQTAREINSDGTNVTNKEAIRKLIKSRDKNRKS